MGTPPKPLKKGYSVNHHCMKDLLIGALRWSERYTKTDMVYLVGNGFWFVLEMPFSWFISLITVLAFANLLPKETYGTYQYVLSIADIFGIMVLSGIDTAVGRAIVHGAEGSLYDGIKTKIRWGLLGGAGSLLLGAYYVLHGNMILGPAFIITSIFIPFWETPGMYVAYLNGKSRFSLSIIWDLVTQFITAVVIVFTLYFSKNLFIILAAYLGSYGLVRTLFLYITVRKFPPNDKRDPSVISYGKHLTVMGATSNISSQVDTVLLWHLLGPVAIAIYVFAQTVPAKAAGVFKIINRIAYPKLVMQDHSTLQKTLPNKVFLTCIFSMLGALAYIACAPLIFGLLFRQYLEAVPYTQALAILIAFQPFSLFSSALTAQAKQKALYVYNFAIPVVRIILFLALIPIFHLWGAICALILVKIVDSALITTLFYRT